MPAISCVTCFGTDNARGRSLSASFSKGKQAALASARSTRLSTMHGVGGLHIVLTEDAARDLDGITWFTLDNFGRIQADRYIEGLRAFLKELPTHQYRLTRNREGSDRCRRAVYKSHVAF